MPTGSASSRSKPFDHADLVAETVMTATRLLMGLSSRSIASVDESITLPQFRLLTTLHAQGPPNLSGLADCLDVNPSTAARMIDRLIGSGLVSRQVNSHSRREIMVELTRTGTNLVNRDDLGKVVLGITSTPQGLSAAEAAVIAHRRQLVARLRELALAEDATETTMHTALGANYWIFGGQYVGIAARRALMPLDQHDIPLICADRSLHVVELKGPDSDRLKWTHRREDGHRPATCRRHAKTGSGTLSVI